MISHRLQLLILLVSLMKNEELQAGAICAKTIYGG
jgi:hypothetical protein